MILKSFELDSVHLFKAIIKKNNKKFACSRKGQLGGICICVSCDLMIKKKAVLCFVLWVL